MSEILIAAAFNMPWDKLIDASLFAFGVVFGALFSRHTLQGTIDYERKKCDKYEEEARELRKASQNSVSEK